MKKILIVFNHPAPYKVKLFNELSKFYDLTVIFERDKNKNRNKLFYENKNYLFKTVNIKGLKILNENFVSSGIVKHLRTNSYDLVVMNGYSTFAEMKAIKYLKKNKVPYLLYINGGIIKENESSLKKKIKSFFISGAKAYLSPDEESNKYLVYYGAEKNKIYNYTYSTIYESEIVKEKNNSSGSQFEKIFVSTGQLIKRKNYLKLVSEFSKINKNYALYIFGDGRERARINKYLIKNNIKNVFLCGHKTRKEIFDFYKCADGFIFSSNEDIYGHVINEALSQGLPVISTKNVNSSKKLLKENYNGCFINNVTTKELYKSIEKITQNNLFKNCIATAKENTIEKMVKDHVEIFDKELSK